MIVNCSKTASMNGLTKVSGHHRIARLKTKWRRHSDIGVNTLVLELCQCFGECEIRLQAIVRNMFLSDELM
jgi:hypothetical protein